MLIIQDLKPTLNVQSDPIKAINYLHDHACSKCLLRYFPQANLYSHRHNTLYLDNDDRIIETSDGYYKTTLTYN